MNKRNFFLFNFIISLLAMSNVYLKASDYIVNDLNTAGIVLQNRDNLYITSTGDIKIFSNADETTGVSSSSMGEIKNLGIISTISNSTNRIGYGSGIMQTTNANNITNSGIVEVNSTNGAWAVGVAQMFGDKFSTVSVKSTENSIKTIKGNIINNGYISAKARAQAVGILEVYGDIVNRGIINVVITDDMNTKYDYATGIWQLDGNNVTNSGDITVSSYDNGYSVGIESDNNAIVYNSGTITVVSRKNSISEGIYGENVDIVNSGIIKSEAEDGCANGIDSSGDGTQAVVNSGHIEVITSGSGNATGIKTSHQNVSNQGSISVISYGYAQSMGIYGFAGDISNSGLINIKSEKASAVGILSQSSGNQAIVNSGTIVAQTSTEDQKSIGIFIPENTFSGTILNTGTIKADIAIYIKVNNQNKSFISNSGLIDTGSISAPFSIFTNSGTLHLRYIKGETVFVDTFKQTISGIFSIDTEIKDAGKIYAVYPTIKAKTVVDIENGSTINVNLISQDNALSKAFLDNGGIIKDIISSSGDINASVDKLNIADNSPIMDFEAYLSDDDKAISLRAVKATKLSLQNSPLSALSAPIVITTTQSTINNIIQNRQNDKRGLNSGDKTFKNKYIWFKPFGTYTKQNNKDGIKGFEADSYGFGIGVDGEYKEGRRVGFAFFYSNTNLNVNDVVQSNDIDMFNFVVYGSNPTVDDRTILFYQMGFGIQKNNSKRYISSIDKSAKADYMSRSFYIQAKITKNYKINNKLTVIPAIKGVLTYVYVPSYSEIGANIYNQNVQNYDNIQTIIGISTSLNYKINDTIKIISDMSMDYNFNNNNQNINLYFEGVPDIVFDAKGIKNSALGYGLGLGISKELKKNLALNLKYNLNAKGNDYVNHSLMVKIKWKF